MRYAIPRTLAVSPAIIVEMKPCPNDGSPMTKHHGAINEEVLTFDMRIERRTRPATFWGCSACEHCEEIGGRS